MADRESTLAIVLNAVDRTTAVFRAVNERIAKVGVGLHVLTAPARLFGERLGGLAKEAGLPKLVEGFKGVGGAFGELFGRIKALGGALVGLGLGAGAVVAGMLQLVEKFGGLGDLAERLGVGVDFLAQLRYAAEKSGASVEQLDAGMQAFAQGLGQMRAGGGALKAFLDDVSPALGRQLKGAKSNEAAFELLARAMDKVKDPAKRLALAQKAVGDGALAPLLARGAKGIDQLRAEYLRLAGSQAGAAGAAGEVDGALKDLGAAADGVKAALMTGLGPAMKIIVDQLAVWLVGHREDIKQWATDIGAKLPAAIDYVVKAIEKTVGKFLAFLDGIGGVKVALGALAAVMVGPMIGAFVKLGVAMATTPFGLVLTALAAISVLVIRITGEIMDMYEAMDTSREKQLQDLAELPLEKYRAKYPETEADDKARALFAPGGALYLDPGPKPELGPGPSKPVLNFQQALDRAQPRAQPPFASSPSSAMPPEVRVKVDFANAPRDARVTTSSQGQVEVEHSVGYQMMGAF